MKLFNKFRRKIHYLIELIKLTESDYLTMKAQSQMYKDMMSTIKYSLSSEYEEAKDASGCLITAIPKTKIATVHINITEMLAEGGIVFNKNVVKLDVTGI